MCYDPWKEPVYRFAELYLQAVHEGTRPDRTDTHRSIWSGRAEFFEESYPGKLETLDSEELDEWLDYIESDFSSDKRLLEPAEKELKRRAEREANGSEVVSDSDADSVDSRT